MNQLTYDQIEAYIEQVKGILIAGIDKSNPKHYDDIYDEKPHRAKQIATLKIDAGYLYVLFLSKEQAAINELTALITAKQGIKAMFDEGVDKSSTIRISDELKEAMGKIARKIVEDYASIFVKDNKLNTELSDELNPEMEDEPYTALLDSLATEISACIKYFRILRNFKNPERGAKKIIAKQIKKLIDVSKCATAPLKALIFAEINTLKELNSKFTKETGFIYEVVKQHKKPPRSGYEVKTRIPKTKCNDLEHFIKLAIQKL